MRSVLVVLSVLMAIALPPGCILRERGGKCNREVSLHELARGPGVDYHAAMKRHPFSDRLRTITGEIVATYGASQKIASHIDPERRLPSRSAVVHVLENLFAVLYPGFYGVQHLTHANVEYHVGALLDDIAADLYEQVVLAYEFLEPGEELPVEGPASGGWQ